MQPNGNQPCFKKIPRRAQTLNPKPKIGRNAVTARAGEQAAARGSFRPAKALAAGEI